MRPAFLLPLLPERNDIRNGFCMFVMWIDLETEFTHIRELAKLVVRAHFGCTRKLVNERVELTGRSDTRIKLPNSACSGIPRVRKPRLPFFLALFVDAR